MTLKLKQGQQSFVMVKKKRLVDFTDSHQRAWGTANTPESYQCLTVNTYFSIRMT